MTDCDTRTISLTGRPPVTITVAQWPIVAQARDRWHDGQVECQANRTSDRRIIVRQHADGRAIVYGYVELTTHWQHETGTLVRRGRLLPTGADLPNAIHAVAGEIAEYDEDGGWGQRAEECISALPAETI